MAKHLPEDFNPGIRSPFRGLGAEVLQQVNPHIKTYFFRKRQIIFREGFKPEGLYIIRKGRVKISKTPQMVRKSSSTLQMKTKC
jgi:signal-transduction protein with cAMP-binding, CBS, and nucleotidyltransferase domain